MLPDLKLDSMYLALEKKLFTQIDIVTHTQISRNVNVRVDCAHTVVGFFKSGYCVRG